MNKKARFAASSSSSSTVNQNATTNIGIDVSMETVDIGVHEGATHWTTENQPAAFPALIKRLKQLKPARIIVEASGGYERVLVARLSAAGLPVIVVNPSKVRHFAKAIGKLAKTDRVDAFLLALFGSTLKLPPVPLKPVETQELAFMVARRGQLVEMLSQERIRLKMALRQEWPQRLVKDLKEHIRELEKRLAHSDDELTRKLQSSPLWQAQDELLQSMPGVGPTTARVLLAQLPELGRTSHSQIAGLCGLAPYTRQTGKWIGRSMIGGGRGRVRTALYLAALVASRHNPVIKALYERLVTAGKAKKLALIACARKLLVLLNAMSRHQTPWRPPVKAKCA